MTRVPQAPSGAVKAQVGHVIHLVWQRAVPAGRRAEQDICLHWQVYLLILLKGVQGLTALRQVPAWTIKYSELLPSRSTAERGRVPSERRDTSGLMTSSRREQLTRV